MGTRTQRSTPHTTAPMNLARSLAAAVQGDSLVVNNRFTSSPTTIKIVFESTAVLAQTDKVTVLLPTWTIMGTTAPTKEGCGTTTFTAAGANTGEANAKVEFTAATADLAA